jgi:N-acetylglucosaminyldiphosphoundecaprenol N-acetyl-beta-D-mannosaminyltransferase
LIERPRLDVLGCRVDMVDASGAAKRVTAMLEGARPGQVVTFGAEMAMHARRDPRYRDVVNSADLVLPDSAGIVWASRMLGRPLRGRVAGIDFAERLCALIGYPVYLLGARPGIAERAAAALRARHPNLAVAGTHHGYFPDAESPALAAAIRQCGARIVFVALGFPRQELWIHDQLRDVGPAVCIGVGGAFDVWAGEVRRAPAAWRALGLEWLCRLLREPARFRRQLALPAFAVAVIAQRLRGAASAR